MSHKPDYNSPWGKPQSEKEMAAIHWRWISSLKTMHERSEPPTHIKGEDWGMAQCGGCCYYIPLEGSIGADWGACSNQASQHDREVVFEHFGCVRHSEAEDVVERDD